MPPKRKSGAGSTAAKKATRGSTSVSKAPSPPPTRSSRSQSARKGPEVDSPLPARRKPSPSPSPQNRGQSRQSRVKPAIKKDAPAEKEEVRTSRSRSQVKTKGDSGDATRVTRAVVEAAEKPRGRSRSGPPKAEPQTKAASKARPSRTQQKVVPKAPKGKKEVEKEESKEDEESEEESEEEEPTPPPKKSKASPQKKTQPKKAQKATPQTPKRQSRVEKTKAEPRSTSRSRAVSAKKEKQAAKELTEAKVELSDLAKTNKSSPQSSPRSRSTSKGRQAKKDVETPVETEQPVVKASPKRQRRSTSKPSPTESKPVRQSSRRSIKGKDAEKTDESKAEHQESADNDEMETEETSEKSEVKPVEEVVAKTETEKKEVAEPETQDSEEPVKAASDELSSDPPKTEDTEMATETTKPLADGAKADNEGEQVDENAAMEQDSEEAAVDKAKQSEPMETLDDGHVENDVQEPTEPEADEEQVSTPENEKTEPEQPIQLASFNKETPAETGLEPSEESKVQGGEMDKEEKEDADLEQNETEGDETENFEEKNEAKGTEEPEVETTEEPEVEPEIEKKKGETPSDVVDVDKSEVITTEEFLEEVAAPAVVETEAITPPEIEAPEEEESEIHLEQSEQEQVMECQNEIVQNSELELGVPDEVEPTIVSLDADTEQPNGSEPESSPGRKRKLDEIEDVDEEDISNKRARHNLEEVQKETIHQNGEHEEVNEVERQPTLLQQAEYQDLSPPEVTAVEQDEMVVEERQDEDMETGEPKMESFVQDVATTAAIDGDISAEYVVINSGDVPPPDSTEVLKSLPSHVIPSEHVEMPSVSDTIAQLPVEPVSVSSDVIEQKETVPVLTQSSEQISSAAKKKSLESVNNESKEFDILLNRRYIPNPDHPPELNDPSRQFSVVSYNILADCHLKRNNYSFTQPEFLDIGYRHKRMMEEINYLNGDIVCMQEVGPEYYTGVLEPAMKSLGYDGIFKKRTKEYFDEGEATFFKTSRFSLVGAFQYCISDLVEKELNESGLDDQVKLVIQEYMDRSDVLVVTRLKCNNSDNILTIGNIHVVWGNNEIPDVQCFQIASAMKEVARLAETASNPYIVCGDFNSEVTVPGYQLAKDGYLSTDLIQQLQTLNALDMPDGSKSSLINQIWPAFQLSTTMKSAYLTAQGHEPAVTTCTGLLKSCVDYLFYNDSLYNIGILESAPEAVVTATGGTPNHIFPSDHLSLKGVFSFKLPL